MATKTPATTTHSATKLDLFLAKMGAQNTNGRMIFALDATASRQPTWDQACELQAEMFNEVATVGGLEIQLVFYRGEQCNATKWMTDSRQLGETMRRNASPVIPKSQKCWRTPIACTINLRSLRWSSLATPWKKPSMSCADAPANSARAVFAFSCFRRARTKKSNRPFAKSLD